MGSFSPLHWMVVAIVVLIFFGPKRLPELAKGLGESIRDFKKAINEETKPGSVKQIAERDSTASSESTRQS